MKSANHPADARLNAPLLRSSAPYAARWIALRKLGVVEEAYHQFEVNGEDALHDLRVSMRRLRSWERLYRRHLSDTVRPKTRRSLADLARATNEARDLEVWLEWLRRAGTEADGSSEAPELIAQLEQEYGAADRDIRNGLRREVPRLLARWRRDLSHLWLHGRVPGGIHVPAMAGAASRALEEHVAVVAEWLDRARPETALEEEIHRLRIEVKRLRYLLETIEGPEAAAAVKRLKEAQDDLGEYRDLSLLRERISGTALEAAAAADAGRALERFRKRWAPPESERFFETLKVLARSLSSGARPAVTASRGPTMEEIPVATSMKIGQVAVTVTDMAKSVAFYKDRVGLPFMFEAPNVAFFDCGGVRLMLGQAEQTDRKPFGTAIYFLVTDIQETFSTLKARDVPVIREPHLVARMADFDLWMAFFRDPDENLFAIMSEVRDRQNS